MVRRHGEFLSRQREMDGTIAIRASMKNLINESLRRTYASDDHLTRRKAMALLWISLAGLPVVLWILVNSLLYGSASKLFYILSIGPMLAVLAASATLILKGAYLRSVHILFALAVLVHLLDGGMLVHEGMLRVFFQGYAAYGYAIVLAASFFVRRWLFHGIAAAEILALPVFGFLLVPPASRVEFGDVYALSIHDGVLSRLMVWGIAWGFVSIMDHALMRVQTELDTNRRLREDLENRVEERTRDLVAARHEAEGANRAKTAFLANISHEIRTPIHGILGMTDLLLEEEGDESKAEKIRVVAGSGQHLLGLIQDILDYSRIEAGGMTLRPVPLELAPFLKGVLEPLEVLAQGKGNSVVLALAPDLTPWTMADGLRLRQILTNLLANAIKFTKDGRVDLVVGMDQATGETVFSVRDTGIGMTPAVLERIFERFRQADESIVHHYGGTGLGLAISRMLTEAMQGRITVESELGHGSCFTVRIPLVSCENPASGSMVDSVCSEPDSRLEDRRVLVVDDNEINRRIAGTILVKYGCEVVLCESAKEALELLSRDPFDLVLMDCHIPGMSGMEATRLLRAWTDDADPHRRETSAVVVIALTASPMEEIREECLASGMDDVLLKPYHPKDLRQMVDHWCGRVHA